MSMPHHSPATTTAEACADCFRQRKCEDCFEELVARFQPVILQFLIHRVGSRHDAEDLLQETFIIAYRKIGSYKSSWKFSTWLFTIATRLAASSGRRKSSSHASIADVEAGSEASPQKIAEEREQRSRLWDRVRQILEPDAFTAVWLSYVESMNADEIGQVIGRNANAVRILLHRARGKLAKQLDSPAGNMLESHHGK